MFISNNRTSFYLWGKENWVKHRKVSKYYDTDCRFNGLLSRNNLPRIKDGACVINLDDKNSKGTQWVSLFIDKNIVIYFDSFAIESIPQELLKKVKGKSITHNIFRVQDNESIMYGFYCITFIGYMLAEKTLLDYTNLFSPNSYKKNGKIIYNYFKDKYGRRGKSRV